MSLINLFLNVGPNLANLIAPTNKSPTRYISSSPISSFVVLNLFLTLDISNSMLQMIAQSCLYLQIYTMSHLILVFVPDILKISSIMPIFKSGTVTNPNNY